MCGVVLEGVRDMVDQEEGDGKGVAFGPMITCLERRGLRCREPVNDVDPVSRDKTSEHAVPRLLACRYGSIIWRLNVTYVLYSWVLLLRRLSWRKRFLLLLQSFSHIPVSYSHNGCIIPYLFYSSECTHVTRVACVDAS